MSFHSKIVAELKYLENSIDKDVNLIRIVPQIIAMFGKKFLKQQISIQVKKIQKRYCSDHPQKKRMINKLKKFGKHYKILQDLFSELKKEIVQYREETLENQNYVKNQKNQLEGLNEVFKRFQIYQMKKITNEQEKGYIECKEELEEKSRHEEQMSQESCDFFLLGAFE